MMPLVVIDHLSVAFRDEDGVENCAVRDASLSIGRGEVLGLVGESGSGKSSVAMSIARLLPSPPARYVGGKVLFDGEDVLSMPPDRLEALRGNRIGVVFQDPIGSLSPLWRVGDQLVESVRLHRRMSRAAAKALAKDWLGKVGLSNPDSQYEAYPHELSGGMQQRVMIAMALINEPDLLIADEPTTALDVTTQAQIISLMRNLRQSRSAILLISHDLGVISGLATRIAVMRSGEVVEVSEDARSFFAAPKHAYSRILVNEARKF